jgi:hypothetical protein
MKTMAEVLAEHQYDRERAVCTCSDLVQVGLRCDAQTHPEHVAEVLTAAGFGPVQEAKAQAWNEAADHANREWRIGHASTAILKGDNPYQY